MYSCITLNKMNKYVLLLSMTFLSNSLCEQRCLPFLDFKPLGSVANPSICETGKRQSPIDLNAFKAKNYWVPYLPIRFENYNLLESVPVLLQSDGHTVNSTNQWEGKGIAISGLMLQGRYKFVDFHIHWARSRLRGGSEHAFFGRRYDAEIHLVHINEAYNNMSEAIKHEDGLLVLGALFIQTDETYQNRHILSVVRPGNKIAEFNFNANLFYGIHKVFNYQGSLTTPPCTENVEWIVPHHLFGISPSTMRALRWLSIRNKEKHNVRPLKPLNHRLVHLYRTFGVDQPYFDGPNSNSISIFG